MKKYTFVANVSKKLVRNTHKLHVNKYKIRFCNVLNAFLAQKLSHHKKFLFL